MPRSRDCHAINGLMGGTGGGGSDFGGTSKVRLRGYSRNHPSRQFSRLFSRDDGFRSIGETCPAFLRVISSPRGRFVKDFYPHFRKGLGSIFLENADFSPKFDVCFCMSFVSIELNKRTGIEDGSPLPTENFRRFYAKHTLFDVETSLSSGLRGM